MNTLIKTVPLDNDSVINFKKNKKTSGAPSQMMNGRSCRLYLDEITLEIAFKEGNGNISKGIRNIVKYYLKNNNSLNIIDNDADFSKKTINF